MPDAKYNPGDILTVQVRVKNVIISKDDVQYGVETVKDRGLAIPEWIGRVPEVDVVNKVSE